jgi:UDP-N-acetylmuramoylalanine--D-glutamate ligase
VAVIGFGVTGQAVARSLLARGEEVVVYDDHPGPATAEAAAALGIEVIPTPAPEALRRGLAASDLVVPSPGVPVSHPVYAIVGELGVPVVSEIELAAGSIITDRPRLIAITGTNGKTTVTTLVTAILRRAGIHALAAGNIGLPLIEAVESAAEVIVAEVSSFQLQYTERFHPGVSCWLNLAADHLDWHPTPEHYAAAKSRIWANQTRGDSAVWNGDDPAVARAAVSMPGGIDRIEFSTSRRAPYWFDGTRLLGPTGPIMPVTDLPRAFPHDIANALAAAAVAQAAGASAQACRLALAEAPLLPHRVSLVGEGGGVSWYDDSKATTPASVLAAVTGFDSVVLIAGGRNKGLDLGVLGSTVPPVRAAVAIGECAGEVGEALAELVPLETAGSMAEAVRFAARLAEPGDAVLLSPGCASFDWYPSYAARGDDFVAAVQKILEKGGPSC